MIDNLVNCAKEYHSYFRTDRGVHALSTTAIVDLQRQADGMGNITYFDPKLITAKLNDYFSISNINIR